VSPSGGIRRHGAGAVAPKGGIGRRDTGDVASSGRSVRSRLGIVVAAALVACAAPVEDETPPGTEADTIPPPPYSEATMPSDSPPSAGTPGEPDNVTRPATKRGVRMIEGTADTVQLELVRAPADFPLAFSTYVPEGIDVESATSDAGHSLKLVAAFDGRRNERAYLQFFFYPEGTTRAVARSNIEVFVSGLNPEVDRTESVTPYPWAIEQSNFTYPHEQQVFLGGIALAQRGNAMFHFLRHYPGDYGDGMASVISIVLGEWRWADGTPLTP
jgi:hypothetical protein